MLLFHCPPPSQAEEEEEEDQPLSLSWPESGRKRFTYLLIIPIVLPLWLTLPDVRKQVHWIGRPTAGTTMMTSQDDPSLVLNLSSCFSSSFPAVVKEVLSNHVPRCHLLDRLLLLPDGVVGSPGTSTLLAVKKKKKLKF